MFELREEVMRLAMEETSASQTVDRLERLRLRLHVRDRWGNACEAEAVGILTSQVEAGG